MTRFFFLSPKFPKREERYYLEMRRLIGNSRLHSGFVFAEVEVRTDVQE